MHLLLVEDQQELAENLAWGLEEAGFSLDIADQGELGLVMAQEPIYDALILDLNLPGLDGLSLLKKIRAQQSTLPVLILTARGELSDRVEGLHAGADDYLSKPFHFEELLARIHALLRRSKQQPFPELSVADLRLNPKTQRVTRQGQLLALTPREYQLLEYLSYNPGRVVSRLEISEHLPDFSTDSNLIDVHIRNLRQKLDSPFSIPLLQTIRGRGFFLGPGPE